MLVSKVVTTVMYLFLFRRTLETSKICKSPSLIHLPVVVVVVVVVVVAVAAAAVATAGADDTG